MPGVSSPANCLAASCAATIRFGSTSVARIDCDTSITSITTARFRGIRTSLVGPAMATVSSTSEHTSRMAGTWRHFEGRLGATLSSNSILANRNMRRCRASRSTTYSATNAAMTNRNRKNHECSKPDSVIGPSKGNVITDPSLVVGRSPAPAIAPRRRLETKRTMSPIQSRSVRSVMTGAPQPRIVRATSARCAAAARAKSVCGWLSMVNSRTAPDSASCRTTSPMSGNSTSRGSSTSMASTSWRAAMARSGRIQLIGPRKSLMITAIPRRRSRPAQRVDGRGQVPAYPDRRLRRGRDGA